MLQEHANNQNNTGKTFLTLDKCWENILLIDLIMIISNVTNKTWLRLSNINLFKVLQ